MLVADEANAASMRDFFQAQGFTVEVFSEASKLYDALCKNGPPGFVFISTQADGPMAKMMPDFVVKRFRTPVFLFREDPQAPSVHEPSASILPPEILLAADYGHEQLLETLQKFEEVYETRLRGPAKPETEKTALPAQKEASRSEEVLRLIKEAFVPDNVPVAEDDVLTLHACKVSDPSGQGYFVFAFPCRGEQKDFDQAMLVLETRVREAAGDSAIIEHLAQAVPANFFKNIQSHSDEVISGKLGGWEMVLLYFRNRKEVAEPEAQILREDVLIPVEEWWTSLPLPCSAYVWLQLNGRKVLYVRSGDRLRVESFDRFKVKGHSHLAVSASDFDHYLKIREIVRVALAA